MGCHPWHPLASFYTTAFNVVRMNWPMPRERIEVSSKTMPSSGDFKTRRDEKNCPEELLPTPRSMHERPKMWVIECWCYPDQSLDALARRAKMLGIAGIDIVEPGEWSTLKKHGLVCTMTPSH